METNLKQKRKSQGAEDRNIYENQLELIPYTRCKAPKYL